MATTSNTPTPIPVKPPVAKAQPAKQTPSVGRIVHFYNGQDSRPHAALVVNVQQDSVNLHVFHPDAGQYNVYGIQHQDDTTSARNWIWPPKV